MSQIVKNDRNEPNYKLIYSDIISLKYPERKEDCKELLDKNTLSVLDIIELNLKIFGKCNQSTNTFNQQHRSYSKSTIFEILNFQKKNNLNNTQVSNYFNLSRKTIAKWKKIFLI